MKNVFSIYVFVALLLGVVSCKKNSVGFDNIDTPRTASIPNELIGRWAIVGISGSTVYNPPSGTHNTNEVFLGYQINKDGTVKEDGYAATYQYGVSTWAKWSALGSVELDGEAIAFHRARGSYTSSRNQSVTPFGASEVYPNKSSYYSYFEVGTNSRGETALFLYDEDGDVHTYVKQ